MFGFLRSLQIFFQSGCTSLHSLSSTKLEIRAKQYLLGSEREGVGRKGGGRGKGVVMTQSLYAHMNKRNLKKHRCASVFIVT
jgi:hypothetical protein